MNAAEAAVAENDDDIAFLQQRLQTRDDGIGIGLIVSGFAGGLDVGHNLLGVQTLGRRYLLQSGDLRHEYPIGDGEGGRKILLEDRATGGVAPRLEERPDAMPGKLLAQAEQRLLHGGWVMAKVINDGDAADRSSNLLAALHALKLRHCLRDFGEGNLVEMGRGNGHGGVAHVEKPAHRDSEFRLKESKRLRAPMCVNIVNAHRGVLRKADFENGRRAVLHDG